MIRKPLLAAALAACVFAFGPAGAEPDDEASPDDATSEAAEIEAGDLDLDTDSGALPEPSTDDSAEALADDAAQATEEADVTVEDVPAEGGESTAVNAAQDFATACAQREAKLAGCRKMPWPLSTSCEQNLVKEFENEYGKDRACDAVSTAF